MVPARIHRNAGPKHSNLSLSLIESSLIQILPKISSMATASKILDAPISPDRHAEKTAAIIPMMTNGDQILTLGKNK